MPIRSKEAYASMLSNPNVQGALNAVKTAEGTVNSADPYSVGFGHATIDSLDAHPGRSMARSFTDKKGRKGVSTAAGAYQMLGSTWSSMAAKLGLDDFSPLSQDIAALGLMDSIGALKPALEGDVKAFTNKAKGTWASLPGAKYNQPTVSMKTVQNAWAAGQKLAAVSSPVPSVNYASLPSAGPVPTTAPRGVPASMNALAADPGITGATAAINAALANPSARPSPTPSLSAAQEANLAGRLDAPTQAYSQASPTMGARAVGGARVSAAAPAGLSAAQSANLAGRLGPMTSTYSGATPTAGARISGAANVSMPSAPSLPASVSQRMAGFGPVAPSQPAPSVSSRMAGFAPTASEMAASARPTTSLGTIGSAFGAASLNAGAMAAGRASANVVDGLTSGIMSDERAANVTGRLNAAETSGLATRAGAGIAGDAAVSMGGYRSAPTPTVSASARPSVSPSAAASAAAGPFSSTMSSLGKTFGVSPAAAATMSAPAPSVAAAPSSPVSTGFAGAIGSPRSQEASIAGPMAAARFAGPISSPTPAATARPAAAAAPVGFAGAIGSPRALEAASMDALTSQAYKAAPASFQTPAFSMATPKIDALGQPPIPGLQRVATAVPTLSAPVPVSQPRAVAAVAAAPVASVPAAAVAASPVARSYAPTARATPATSQSTGLGLPSIPDAPTQPSALGRVGSYLGDNMGKIAGGFLGTAVAGPVGGLIGSLIGSRLQGGNGGTPSAAAQAAGAAGWDGFSGMTGAQSDAARNAGSGSGKSGSSKSSTSSASKSGSNSSGGRGGGIGPGGSGGRDPSNNK